MIPPVALSFLKSYWKEAAALAIIVALLAYAQFLRLQRDNISLSFTNYQLAAENAVKQREIEIKVKDEQSNQRASINESIYAKEIAKQQAEIKRLGGNVAGLVGINSGLRNAAESNASALRELLKSSEVASSANRDCNLRIADANKYIRFLRAAAIDTDTKYEACIQGWNDECSIKGCG